MRPDASGIPRECGAPMSDENGQGVSCRRPAGHSPRSNRLSRAGHDPVRRELEWRVEAHDVYDS